MCRFVAYIGDEATLISELIEKPDNSLVNQSRPSEDGSRKINADGVGIAWYDKRLDKVPGVFRSVQPAWNDQNLKHIASKIKSGCFLAHIRASTVGDVTINNCHPFSFNEYSLVHNGSIRQFNATIKRDIINALSDELFLAINGSTDSEYLFHLIMYYLYNDKLSLEDAVFKAFKWVVKKQESLDPKHYSKLNIAITDGHTLIATRFSTKGNSCLSLHYSISDNATIVSSEPLDDTNKSWSEVPENHYLHVEKTKLNPVIKTINL